MTTSGSYEPLRAGGRVIEAATDPVTGHDHDPRRAPELPISHSPRIASLSDGSWGVFCEWCSNDEGDYVFPCRYSAYHGEFPERDRLIVRPRPTPEESHALLCEYPRCKGWDYHQQRYGPLT